MLSTFAYVVRECQKSSSILVIAKLKCENKNGGFVSTKFTNKERICKLVNLRCKCSKIIEPVRDSKNSRTT